MTVEQTKSGQRVDEEQTKSIFAGGVPESMKSPVEVPKSVFADTAEDLYVRHEVTIRMLDRLYGGVPNNPKTIDGWIRSQAGIEDEEERRALMLRTLQELGHTPETTDLEALEEASQQIAGRMNTNGFKRDEHGLYVEGRQLMSMLRESLSVLYTGYKWGYRPAGKLDNGSKGKAATSFFRERVHVPDARIYLGRDEPDGVELKIVHPKDPTRESSLTYVQYVEKATLSFTLEEVKGTATPQQWASIWTHAERNGLGAGRSQQAGKFVVTHWT